MINCFSLAGFQLCGGLWIDFEVVLAEALALYTLVIHKNPITWAADHRPPASVLTWLSLPITPTNTFAFGGVGEAAQGNQTCKLIKLLGLVELRVGDVGRAGNRSDSHLSSQ